MINIDDPGGGDTDDLGSLDNLATTTNPTMKGAATPVRFVTKPTMLWWADPRVYRGYRGLSK